MISDRDCDKDELILELCAPHGLKVMRTLHSLNHARSFLNVQTSDARSYDIYQVGIRIILSIYDIISQLYELKVQGVSRSD